MTEAGDVSEMSQGGGDIEAGSSSGQSNDLERGTLMTGAHWEEMVDQENSDGQVPDIDKWAASLLRILEDVPRYMYTSGHPGRVGRIPENLREVDVKAYEPHFISIGPYHRGKQRLEDMETTKLQVLNYFLEHKPELTLRDYLKEIESIEQEARSFYSDVEMGSEEFVQMLLLDGLYIVTAFCGLSNNQDRMRQTDMRTGSSAENDEMNERANQINEGTSSNNGNTQLIARTYDLEDRTRSGTNNILDKPRWFGILFPHDLFLLENQLPFFVLTKVHNLAYGGSGAQLIGTMKDAFYALLSEYTKPDPEMIISTPEEIHHLLHLCHMFFHPKLQQESTTCQLYESSTMFRLDSAMQLSEAGVSFEARSHSTIHSLLDVTFSSSGKMVMPCLHVDDNTVALLRNLIALEQMKYPVLGLDVSAYAVLLLHLVTTPKDVELLRRKGIIVHHLASDKEMMYFINRLSVGLAFDYTEDKYSLKPVFCGLKSYSQRRGPGWRAWLKHRHFKNLWTVVSLFAASLLLLTSLQTYYVILLQSLHQ